MSSTENSAPLDTDELLVVMFHYSPSITDAYLFLGLFGLVTLVIAVMTAFWRTHKIMWLIVFTGILEMLGYAMRIMCINSPGKGLFIGTTCLLLIAPIALAFVNYVIVGDLLRASGRNIWFIRPDRLAQLFLASDVLCLIVQGGGGGLMADSDNKIFNIGKALVLFGLCLQLVFFTGFTAITVILATNKTFLLTNVPALRPVFAGLLLTIVLMYVRNIYRVIDFSADQTSYVDTHEFFFYVFESFPILSAFAAYAGCHFGRLLGTNDKSGVPVWQEQLESVRAGNVPKTTVEMELTNQ